MKRYSNYSRYFSRFCQNVNWKNVEWTTIQQKVLKKNRYVRDSKGLNVIKYHVKGKSKQATVNAILFQNVSRGFGPKKPPEILKCLMKEGGLTELSICIDTTNRVYIK